METNAIIKSGIGSGCILEYRTRSPGYLGLEWLKKTQGTTLKGLDISPDMIAVAATNASEYGLSDRVEYVQSTVRKCRLRMTCSMRRYPMDLSYEWQEPDKTIDEIWRVLKPQGKVFIAPLMSSKRRYQAMLEISGLCW